MRHFYTSIIAFALLALPAAARAQVPSLDDVDLSKMHILKMGVDTIHYAPVRTANAAKSNKIGGVDASSINVTDYDKPEYFGFQYATYSYPSVTSDGSEVTLSSLIAWPVGNKEIYLLGNHNVTNANNLIIGCHVTITDNTECPSEWVNTKNTMSDVRMYVGHAGGGFGRMNNTGDPEYWDVVIMPDYEGYGVSKDRAHPYLDQELTARQVMDGVLYGLKWYNSQTAGGERGQVVPLKDSWKTVVAGYSQGGAVAMAVHRFIETSHLDTELHFAGSVCGDGPYDVMATLKQYIDWNRVYYSCAVPLILKGMVDHCPYIKDYHKLSDYLSAEYLATGVDTLITAKTYSTDAIITETNTALVNNGGSLQPITYTDGYNNTYSYLETDKMMTKEAYDYCKNFAAPIGRYGTEDGVYGDLQRAFEANSLLRGWQPTHPMYMLHSYNDQVVPYVNMANAMTAFANNSNVHCYAAGDSNHINDPWAVDLSNYGHNNTGVSFIFAITNDDVQNQNWETILGGLNDGGSFEEQAIKAVVENANGDSSATVADKSGRWTKVK